MKMLQETRRRLGRLIHRFVNWLLGPACEKCGKRNLAHSHHWIRGYNEYCQQATGDDGWRCYDCGHIKWDRSLEDYKACLPTWCRAYKDS